MSDEISRYVAARNLSEKVGNVSSVQVSRLANSLRTQDVASANFRANLADALLELDRRTVSPSVSASNLVAGTIPSGVSISAGSIQGTLNANQIGTVNMSSLIGTLNSGDAGSINMTALVGELTVGMGATINATSITGVVVSSQIADGIIDSLNRFNSSFRPLVALSSAPSLPNTEYPLNSFYYNTTNEKFYQNQGGTWTEVSESTAVSGSLSYYFIGKVNVNSFVGLITASQIGSVNASSITGTITAEQIASVNASTITGTITAGGPVTVQVGALSGTIAAGGGVVINGNSIQNLTIPGSAIINGAIGTAQIADASITNAKIAALSVSKLTAGTATFTGTTRFGTTPTSYVEIGSTLRVQSSPNEFVAVGFGGIEINHSNRRITIGTDGIITQDAYGNYKVEVTDSLVKLTGGSSGAEVTLETSGLRLKGEGLNASQAVLTNSSLRITKGTANTEVSASGVQIWGGTNGIGIGASTFADSPMQLTSTFFKIRFASGVIRITSDATTISHDDLTGVVVSSGDTSINGNLTVANGGDINIYSPGVLKIEEKRVVSFRQLAVGDASECTIDDADATYGAEERDLINDLKSKYNDLQARFNDLLDKLGTSGHGLTYD